jgi:hypothetical protein
MDETSHLSSDDSTGIYRPLKEKKTTSEDDNFNLSRESWEDNDRVGCEKPSIRP